MARAMSASWSWKPTLYRMIRHFSCVRVILQAHAVVRVVFGGRTPIYSYRPALRVMSPDVGGVPLPL